MDLVSGPPCKPIRNDNVDRIAASPPADKLYAYCL